MSELKFKSITINNFKTFRGGMTFDLERPPGLFYVTGKNLVNPELGANGVGKSSLWDALFWCLWGKTIRDNRPAEAVKPWSLEKGSTVVALTFDKGDTEYTLERTRNPNGLHLWTIAYEDNEREIQQEEVPKLIGMSEEMFRRTLVLGQFGTLFLDLKPEAQAQMFNEALGLDVWLKAASTAADAGKAARQQNTQALADMRAQDRLLIDLALQLDETQAAASLFEKDKAIRIKKTKAGIATLEKDLAELKEVKQPKLPDKTKSTQIQTQLANLRASMKALLSDMRKQSQDIEVINTRLSEFKAQANKKKKVCETCRQPITDSEFEKQQEDLHSKLEELITVFDKQTTEADSHKVKGEKLNKELVAAEQEEKASSDKYDAAMADYTNYTANLAAWRAELARQRRTLAEQEASENTHELALDRLRTRRGQYRGEKAELEEKQAQAAAMSEVADFWMDGFREIRLSIIDRALLELEMATSRHAAMLGLEDWGIKFDTEKETQSGKVTYSFTVLLFPPGQENPVKWESYSGGESQRWQLAVAFALSEVLLARAGLSPSLEVLDEPTRGLSSDGVGDLLNHLRDRALELGRSIYFCDHHSLDKGSFDGTLVVTKSEKGSSFKWQ